MSGGTETGEISQNHQIEWTINNFFSYKKVGEYLQSPKFFSAGSEWYLELYPNGEVKDTNRWLTFYLIAKEYSTPTSVNYRFGIKKRDGTILEIGSGCDRWAYPEHFHRTDLLTWQSELVRSDSLIITCSIRMNNGSSETASGLEKLSDDLGNMFQSRKGCDATLKVQNKEFPINRSILAARSPVFDAIFKANMRGKKTGVVNIKDCHPGTFEDFLAYIYSGKLECTSGKIFELYTIAHKYNVELLKSECVAFMMKNMDENVVDAYVIGHSFDEKELKEKSQAFFNENFSDIISDDKWASLYREKPTFVNMLLKGMAKYTLMGKKKRKIN